MPALTEIFGDDACLQFGGGTLGHPWGNAPGAAANRVASEVCVQAVRIWIVFYFITCLKFYSNYKRLFLYFEYSNLKSDTNF